MYDLVIRNGTIIDGTGKPGFVADVAIQGRTIVAVGEGLGPGTEEIDATGMLVTPGWVDMHTHYDGQATWDPWLTPSGWHGVTTVVMGNCGVGFAPCREGDRDWLIDTMEGVEDIPGTALSEGMVWSWETFPEYLDALDKLPLALDIGTQVPHAAVRGWVMGHKGAEDEAANADEIQQMKAVVKEALEAGALGFSTSRTSLHKTARGNLMAGTFATKEELFGIGEAIAEHGFGVYELADEHADVPADTEWMRELAVLTKQPVVFNLSQIDTDPELWRKGLAAVESAQAEGLPLYCQVAGRSIGIVMNWQGTVHPFVLCDAHAMLAHLEWPERLAKLQDPETRAAITSATPFFAGEFEQFVTRSWDKMYLLGDGNDYEPDPSTSLAAKAEKLGVSPAELAYDALMEGDGSGCIYFPLFNYSHAHMEHLRELHTHPHTRMGLSDGGAHVGTICDGGMPTFMLSFWARDRSRGDTIPLETIVKRQTSETARFYGLGDRGVLAPGYLADVNVIDFDALSVEPPRMAFDLPAEGRRLVQKAVGYRATVKSGVVIARDGEITGALPGGLVRGPQASPVA